MWVRGLKQKRREIQKRRDSVAPHVGAWIETRRRVKAAVCKGSHPMWVRGLKQRCVRGSITTNKSHPMWVRGLKQRLRLIVCITTLVAPHVGAWIETNLF